MKGTEKRNKNEETLFLSTNIVCIMHHPPALAASSHPVLLNQVGSGEGVWHCAHYGQCAGGHQMYLFRIKFQLAPEKASADQRNTCNGAANRCWPSQSEPWSILSRASCTYVAGPVTLSGSKAQGLFAPTHLLRARHSGLTLRS